MTFNFYLLWSGIDFQWVQIRFKISIYTNYGVAGNAAAADQGPILKKKSNRFRYFFLDALNAFRNCQWHVHRIASKLEHIFYDDDDDDDNTIIYLQSKTWFVFWGSSSHIFKKWKLLWLLLWTMPRLKANYVKFSNYPNWCYEPRSAQSWWDKGAFMILASHTPKWPYEKIWSCATNFANFLKSFLIYRMKKKLERMQ